MAALNKARGGDPLKIPASTWNAFVDAARAHRERQRNTVREAQRPNRRSGIVLVRNESGATRDRFDVLGIAGPLIEPAENLPVFEDRVVIRGVVPSTAHRGGFVVLLEPLQVGGIGRALIDGVCAARVLIRSQQQHFADVKPEDATSLQSDSAGSAQLLWVQPPDQWQSNVAWTLCRLGLPSGLSLQPVRVSKVGGEPGSHNSRCTFVYDVWPATDEELDAADRIGVSLTPRMLRCNVGPYEWEYEGILNGVQWGYGLAWRNAEGQTLLYSVAGEFPRGEACP